MILGSLLMGHSPSDFVALVKPRITALVIMTTACGLWMASHNPPAILVIATISGTVLLVGAANSLNMYIERETDALMRRTKDRPLPAKRMKPIVALWFGVTLAAIAVVVLTLFVNHLTGLLGLIAFISYVLFYTPLKQKSTIALLIGAVPGALPPLMGWTAVTGTLKIPQDLPGLTLFFILFLWQIPHFLAIALFHREEYARAGIKIMPIENGEKATKHCILRYTAGLVAVSLYPVWLGQAGLIYFITALGLGMVFFGLSLWGLRLQSGVRWAKIFFIASIIYLPVLLGVLALTGHPSY